MLYYLIFVVLRGLIPLFLWQAWIKNLKNSEYYLRLDFRAIKGHANRKGFPVLLARATWRCPAIDAGRQFSRVRFPAKRIRLARTCAGFQGRTT
jgi:hypothetical protein